MMLYNKNMDKGSNIKKLVGIGIVLVILILLGGFFIGQYVGKDQGQKETAATYQQMLDSVFPPPPSVIHSLTGTVTGTYGATLSFTVNNPNDYLPHLDKSPIEKQTRTAKVYSGTKLLSLDYSKMNKNGNPATSTFSLSDLKNGDTVTVKSTANIKDSPTFDASEIDLIKY